MKIFVYGTLMAGESNHSVLDCETTEYLGEAVTSRGFALYNLGGFPGMVCEGNDAVVGEIYKITPSTLRQLDILEGHPQFYRRSIIELQTGEQIQTYVLHGEYVRGCPLIKSGSWKNK